MTLNLGHPKTKIPKIPTPKNSMTQDANPQKMGPKD